MRYFILVAIFFLLSSIQDGQAQRFKGDNGDDILIEPIADDGYRHGKKESARLGHLMSHIARGCLFQVDQAETVTLDHLEIQASRAKICWLRSGKSFH